MNRVDEERQYWDKAALDPQVRDRFIIDRTVSDEDCIDIIVAAAPEKAGLIIEIGSGIGRLTKLMGKEFPTNLVIGFDISAPMVALANAQDLTANVFHVQNDGRTLPTGNNSASFVYSMVTFQHIDDAGMETYIKEVARVLKPGGIFTFQFIEGTEHEPFSQHHLWADVMHWLEPNKLIMLDVKRGLLHPQWTWVIAEKIL